MLLTRWPSRCYTICSSYYRHTACSVANYSPFVYIFARRYKTYSSSRAFIIAPSSPKNTYLLDLTIAVFLLIQKTVQMTPFQRGLPWQPYLTLHLPSPTLPLILLYCLQSTYKDLKLNILLFMFIYYLLECKLLEVTGSSLLFTVKSPVSRTEHSM